MDHTSLPFLQLPQLEEFREQKVKNASPHPPSADVVHNPRFVPFPDPFFSCIPQNPPPRPRSPANQYLTHHTFCICLVRHRPLLTVSLPFLVLLVQLRIYTPRWQYPLHSRRDP